METRYVRSAKHILVLDNQRSTITYRLASPGILRAVAHRHVHAAVGVLPAEFEHLVPISAVSSLSIS